MKTLGNIMDFRISIFYNLDVNGGSKGESLPSPHAQSRVGESVNDILTGKIYHTYIDDLDYEQAEKAKGKFLFVEFPEGQTHTSIIHTSTLSDGSEIFTVRFGIRKLGSPRPVYNGIALFRRFPDGTIQIQEPLKKPEEVVRVSKEEEKEAKKLYLSQLQTITKKIGELSDGSILENLENSLILQNNGGHIYDISDSGKPGTKQFLVTFSTDSQNLECQISVYKEENRDVIEVHSLVREGDAGVLNFMSWFIGKAFQEIQKPSNDVGLLENEDTIDVFLTRDERHDVDGDEHRNRKPLRVWKKVSLGTYERERTRTTQ